MDDTHNPLQGELLLHLRATQNSLISTQDDRSKGNDKKYTAFVINSVRIGEKVPWDNTLPPRMHSLPMPSGPSGVHSEP